MKSLYLILFFILIVFVISTQEQDTNNSGFADQIFSIGDSPDAKCLAQGGTCMNPSNCEGNGGSVLSGLCPGNESNKCCIPISEKLCEFHGGTCMSQSSCTGDSNIVDNLCPINNNNKCCINKNPEVGKISNQNPNINPNPNPNSDPNNNLLYVIIIILSALIVIIIILYISFTLSKKWITRSISTSIKNMPSLNNNYNSTYNNNNNNNNSNSNGVEQPPSYFDVINEESEGDIVIYSTASSSSIKKNSSSHGNVRISPNKSSLKNRLFSIIEGGHSGSVSSVERSQAVMINLDEPLESSSSIKKKKSVSTPEKTQEEEEDSSESSSSLEGSINERRATFNTIERSKAVMVKKMNSLPYDYRYN